MYLISTLFEYNLYFKTKKKLPKLYYHFIQILPKTIDLMVITNAKVMMKILGN